MLYDYRYRLIKCLNDTMNEGINVDRCYREKRRYQKSLVEELIAKQITVIYLRQNELALLNQRDFLDIDSRITIRVSVYALSLERDGFRVWRPGSSFKDMSTKQFPQYIRTFLGV